MFVEARISNTGSRYCFESIAQLQRERERGLKRNRGYGGKEDGCMVAVYCHRAQHTKASTNVAIYIDI